MALFEGCHGSSRSWGAGPDSLCAFRRISRIEGSKTSGSLRHRACAVRESGKWKVQAETRCVPLCECSEERSRTAAVADYDRDGRLDIYSASTTIISPGQYHYPVPYF